MPGKHSKSGARKHTPITSGRQQRAMGVAYAAKKGQKIKGGLKGPAKSIAESMTKAELKVHLQESKGKF